MPLRGARMGRVIGCSEIRSPASLAAARAASGHAAAAPPRSVMNSRRLKRPNRIATTGSRTLHFILLETARPGQWCLWRTFTAGLETAGAIPPDGAGVVWPRRRGPHADEGPRGGHGGKALPGGVPSATPSAQPGNLAA